MMTLNKLLKQQIDETFEAGKFPEELSSFVYLINETYNKFEVKCTLSQEIVEKREIDINELTSNRNTVLRQPSQKQREFKSQLNTIQDVLFSIDIVAKKVLKINASCENAYGRTMAEFYSDVNLWEKVILEADLENFQKYYPVILSGNTFNVEYRIRHTDDTVRWLKSNITPTLNSKLELIRIDVVSADITYQKREEYSKKESENKYRSLFETTVDGIYKSSHDGKFIDVNPALVRMLGYDSKKELLAIDIKSQLYFEKTERDNAVIKDQTDGISVFRLRKKDGSEIWVEDRGQYVSDEFGNLLYHEGILRNVTEREKAKEKNRLNEERLRAIFDNEPECVKIVDLNGKLLEMNPAGIEMTEAESIEQLKGKDVINLVHLEDREIYLDLHKRVLAGEKGTASFRIIGLRQTQRWMETHSVPLRDANGTIYAALSVTRDVSGEIKAKNELIQSEQHNRNLFNHSTIGLVLAGMDGTLQEINEEYISIIGYTHEEARKLTYWDITPDKYSEIEKEKLNELLSTGKYSAYEKEYIHKNGSLIPVRMSGVIIEKNGEKFILSCVENITESTIAQEAILRQNAELLKTNAELDKFVYSISHDLRAPLLSMQGVVEITEGETEDELILEHMKMLRESIKRLDNFIGEILDYSRNARGEIKLERIDFKQLLEELSISNSISSEKMEHLFLNIEITGTGIICSDKDRISTILNSLISNSIRYSNPENEKPFVKISVEANDKNAKIEVEDNGIGINEEFHERVFEMFSRVSKKSKGSGLGLYIVKETVDKLKGDIQLNSIPGVGTKVSVTIPNLYYQ